MEQKKRIWPNLLGFNMKIGKKGKKKKTPLKYRRSMSVPDLRVRSQEMLASDESRPSDQDTVFFGNLVVPGDPDETGSETSSLGFSDHMPYSCSPAPSERSIPVDFPVSAESATDKKSERPRTTMWYVSDSDTDRASPALRLKDPSDKVTSALIRAGAGRQTPLGNEMSALATTESFSTGEEQMYCPAEQEPKSPSEMFVIGSAVDLAYVSYRKVTN